MLLDVDYYVDQDIRMLYIDGVPPQQTAGLNLFPELNQKNALRQRQVGQWEVRDET